MAEVTNGLQGGVVGKGHSPNERLGCSGVGGSSVTLHFATALRRMKQ